MLENGCVAEYAMLYQVAPEKDDTAQLPGPQRQRPGPKLMRLTDSRSLFGDKQSQTRAVPVPES